MLFRSYLGGAVGEAFRNNGKTDICIEEKNRAAFVAECKMWTGQKAIADALKQLDSYLTWRDCKTALIYFVRKKDFLAILQTAEEALRALPEMRQVQILDKNEFKCCMISTQNPGQQIQVRVILFNIQQGSCHHSRRSCDGRGSGSRRYAPECDSVPPAAGRHTESVPHRLD